MTFPYLRQLLTNAPSPVIARTLHSEHPLGTGEPSADICQSELWCTLSDWGQLIFYRTWMLASDFRKLTMALRLQRMKVESQAKQMQTVCLIHAAIWLHSAHLALCPQGCSQQCLSPQSPQHPTLPPSHRALEPGSDLPWPPRAFLIEVIRLSLKLCSSDGNQLVPNRPHENQKIHRLSSHI